MTEHDHLVTLQYFIRDMLGLKDRNWLYKHRNDRGMPRIIKVGRRSMVSLKEGEAYMELLKKARQPAEPPKRKRGRPRKNPEQVSA